MKINCYMIKCENSCTCGHCGDDSHFFGKLLFSHSEILETISTSQYKNHTIYKAVGELDDQFMLNFVDDDNELKLSINMSEYKDSDTTEMEYRSLGEKVLEYIEYAFSTSQKNIRYSEDLPYSIKMREMSRDISQFMEA